MKPSESSVISELSGPLTASLERPAPETNWDAFVDAYGRVALEWFRQAGLPLDDVHDVVSKMMIELHAEFLEVVAAPELRFRAWLQFAADRAWNSLAAEQPAGPTGKEPKWDLLQAEEAREAFLQALDAECSHLRRRQILGQFRSRAGAVVWESFARTVLNCVPAETVAA